MERTYIKDVFGKSGEVLLKGWVHDTRDLKKVRFLILKDKSGRIQITGFEGKTTPEIFELMDKIKRESSVEIIGNIQESKQAPNGKEIVPTSIKLISPSEDIPIDISDYSKTELPTRLDYRFLDLHSRRTQIIFKVQSTILQGFREFMYKEGAIEFIPPSIIGSSSEGGTEMFKAKYFEKDAFLSQSCQLYKQIAAVSFEKVFATPPVWRAEKHNTTRHLNESHQLDYEEAFADDKKVMEVMARCVQYIVKKITEYHSEDLKTLKIELKVPETKYMTFAEAAELMKKEKVKISEHDLSGEAEKKLGELFPNTIVFVHDWPIKGKPFYIMPEGSSSSKGFDAIWKGMEITSGGQRIHIPELLEKQLKKKDLRPEDFKAYIDTFRYGAPPHAGWAIGVERLTMLSLGLDNIREAALFPRDRERLTP